MTQHSQAMRYAILEFNRELLKWEVVFYTFSFDDYQSQAPRFPKNLFTHMIDLGAIKGHQMMEKLQG